MEINAYEVLLNAPAQKYYIETFYPLYVEIQENPNMEDIMKLKPRIIEVLNTYIDKMKVEELKVAFKEYTEKIAENPDDENL